MKVLFYGNCQLHAIKETLRLPKYYEIFSIPCWTTDCDEKEFTQIIKKCDIIITQSINDNYRNVNYLSTSYIIAHSNSNCKIIIFDSCHFDFYYVDLTYRMFNNDVLHNPSDYHYNNMIDCYRNNSIEYYIENFVNNKELKTSEEVNTKAENSLNELNNRFINNKEKYNKEKYNKEIYIITTGEFIKNNYKNKLLFYSMNHPTKYVIQFICEEITNLLQIPNTIDYENDYLAGVKCILYKCIQKNVHFDINEHKPLLDGVTDISEITQKYYNAYKEIGFS